MLTESPFLIGRRQLKLSQQELARRLDISRSYLSQLENGHRKPSPKLSSRLSDLLSKIAPKWRSVLGEGTARLVPVVSWARAGFATSYEEIPKEWQTEVPTDCRDPEAFGLRLEGDSMEPNFSPGDIVVVMPGQEPRSHGLVVARLKDGGVRFKILTLHCGARPIQLSSYKADAYPAEDFLREDFDWIYPVYEMRRMITH